MRTRRLFLISCAPRRRGRDGLRRDPKLALNLLLDEPPKLLEELPHRASTTSATSATGGRRLSSASPRSYCPPPWLSPAGFLMPEVGRSPRLPAAVWTGVYAECGALARLRLRHVSSRERWPPLSLSGETASVPPLHAVRLSWSWPDRAVRVCSHWPLPRQKSRTPKFIGSFSRRRRELPG